MSVWSVAAVAGNKPQAAATASKAGEKRMATPDETNRRIAMGYSNVPNK